MAIQEESRHRIRQGAEKMDKIRKAWIQVPDFTSYDIGEVSRSEIDRLWGSRWAQKCIRDVAEQVAIARFSPIPRSKSQDFCSPQLGFEQEGATLAVSPYLDVKPAILYGSPLQDFDSWTVFLHIKRGRRFLGIVPIDFSFEMVVSQEEAGDLIRLFYDHTPTELAFHAKTWKGQILHRYRHRLVGAFFL